MSTALRWLLSPVGAAMTAYVALTYADGVWQWALLGVAALELLPPLLFVGLLVIAFLGSERGAASGERDSEE